VNAYKVDIREFRVSVFKAGGDREGRQPGRGAGVEGFLWTAFTPLEDGRREV
jgi:hypothetical protein